GASTPIEGGMRFMPRGMHAFTWRDRHRRQPLLEPRRNAMRSMSSKRRFTELALVLLLAGSASLSRRVWSIGRDLILRPKQDGEPVNALPKAYMEIDGQVHPEGTGWVRKLTYREQKAS